jgi:Thiamine pyrophosphate-requiring enzymes [acetolactate synthase, pyruvate dehydrogenase (cytochrome), glyoxylate carboligase, phosphonopyruvate decarboxylase]
LEGDVFQECDTTGFTRPCTKHNYLVKDVNKLSTTIHEAFEIANNGRPGPVLIDIPKDVQFAKGKFEKKENIIIPKHRLFEPKIIANKQNIYEAAKLISGAKKPILYIGGGCINSGPHASKLITDFIEETGIPATMTLMGLGVLGSSNKHSLGMLGMHGMYEANMAMHDCDVMINIGARFDDRVTGRLDAFSPNSKKIHIDIDASNVNKTIKIDLPIIGDVGSVMKDFMTVWKDNNFFVDKEVLQKWWKKIEDWKKVDFLKFEQSGKTIKPQYPIKGL